MLRSMLDRLGPGAGGGFGSRIRDQWRRTSFHQWIAGLSPRDRGVVHGLMVVGALLLVYGAVWKPVADWRDRADARYRQAVLVHEWVAANQARLQAAGPSTGERRSGTLLVSLVANSAAGAGIQIARVQPEGQGEGVSVVIQDQDFNQVLHWLDQLTRREQLTVRQLSIDGQANPGRISARISMT
jgi:general secretion pathway protein M